MMVTVSEEVAQARREGVPLVGLESTVYSHLGLPSPHNEEALKRSIDAIVAAGAVPVITAIIDGTPRAGLEPHEYDRILGPAIKVAERDISVAIGRATPVGATTVSASLALCEAAGISVFATGGIGGVHRGAAESFDVSADLASVATRRVATVSAGAKSFLDIRATLELLETLGVPVLGWQTDRFPAFTARNSAAKVAHRIDSLVELVAIASVQLNKGGLLVANPVPAAAALDQELHDTSLEQALRSAGEAGISGAALTPYVLAAMAEATAGKSIPANIALLENNCRLAAALAVGLADVRQSEPS